MKLDDIINKIDSVAKKYSKPFYVRARENSLVLWGLKCGNRRCTIAFYPSENKLFIKTSNGKIWLTTNAVANHGTLLEELEVEFDKELKRNERQN